MNLVKPLGLSTLCSTLMSLLLLNFFHDWASLFLKIALLLLWFKVIFYSLFFIW
jgi:hypothetical protein